MTTALPDLNPAAKTVVTKQFPAPKLRYQPRKPKKYRPRIAMVGCGWISEIHLQGYKQMGYDVVAFCDVIEENARRRLAYYPKATVHTDPAAILADASIHVVDIATHPAERVPLIERALKAGKHVLSQKPFVLDLATGKRLAALAKKKRVLLAVNQNGRWAPAFSYMREAIKAGLLGEVTSVDSILTWDHTCIQGTPFERMDHCLLYDYAIHWIDLVTCMMGKRRAVNVLAREAHVAGQTLQCPMSTSISMAYPGGLASLSFHANTFFANSEVFTITGTKGFIQAQGRVCAPNDLLLRTARGEARPQLVGDWFPQGMAGAMSELLCAIEEGREPENSATNNLESLALSFAALESTRTGKPEVPGKVTSAGPGCTPRQ